jgi:hypothetical protein
MSKMMNYMMNEAEAGRFEFHEPPDYPDEAEYYGHGFTFADARELLGNAPKDAPMTDEQLDDFANYVTKKSKEKDFVPFEDDEIPF